MQRQTNGNLSAYASIIACGSEEIGAQHTLQGRQLTTSDPRRIARAPEQSQGPCSAASAVDPRTGRAA
jgi:hypothetical protein